MYLRFRNAEVAKGKFCVAKPQDSALLLCKSQTFGLSAPSCAVRIRRWDNKNAANCRIFVCFVRSASKIEQPYSFLNAITPLSFILYKIARGVSGFAYTKSLLYAEGVNSFSASGIGSRLRLRMPCI